MIKESLIQSRKEEKIAIENYTRRMKTAQLKGDKKTVDLYKHIIKEEVQHYHEFSKRINQL